MKKNRQEEIPNGLDYCIFYTDKNGLIKSFNKGAEIMLGYKSQEVTNKINALHFHDNEEINARAKALGKELKKTLSPGFEVLIAKANEKISDTQDWTFVKKNGNKLYVRLSVIALLNETNEITGYLEIANDITHSKKAQKQILIYEDIVKNMSSGLYVLRLNEMEEDFDFELIACNEASKELTGFDSEKLIGKRISEIIPSFFTSSFPKVLKKVALGLEKDFHIEFEYGDKIIKKGYYSVHIFSLPNKGIGVSFENNSARKKMELELIKAKELAEKSLHTKDVFLANMSHEIRTPMNAILGFTDLLINTPLTKDQQESIMAVKSAGENLTALINDILDFSKIESGKLTIENAPFNISETLRKINTLLKIKAREKKIDLNFNLDANLPNLVFGDKVRLSQVLMNLIGNAIKFTEKGFVNVTVKQLKEDGKMHSIFFSIKDSGIGIPEDKHKSIFERFIQASSETNRKYGGTGLGLSISKNLVELCGGKLSVKSKLGKGSEFCFTQKFLKVDKNVIIKSIEKGKEGKPKGKVKILLAEDNILNQKLAKKVIEGFDFEIDIVENGKQAIEKLQHNNYSLVLMDLQMPEMDGYKATKHIRKKLKLNLPIMAMTAHSIVGEREKCMDAGMNDYISKPFKADSLYSKICRLLNHYVNDSIVTNEKNLTTIKISDSPNLDYLKGLSGGNIEFEKEMIELFLNYMPVNISQLEMAIKSNDFETIKAIVHKLQSSFSVMGMNDVIPHLKELQILADGKKGKAKSSALLDLIDKRFWKVYPILFKLIEEEY